MIKVGDLVRDTQTYVRAHEQALGVVIKIMESKDGYGVGVMGVCVKWSDAPLNPPLWHRPHRLEKVNG